MKILIKLFFLLLVPFTFYAQNNHDEVFIKFNADTLSLDATKVVTAALKLKNNLNTSSVVEIKLKTSSSFVRINGSDLKRIELKPFEQLFLPVTAVFNGDKFETFSLHVNAIVNNRNTLEHELIINPPIFKNVVLVIPQKRIEYNNRDTNLTLPILVKNKGSVNERLNLVIKWPEKFNGESTQTFTFNLNAGKDTLIDVNREINVKQSIDPPSRANVTLYYSNYDFIKSEEVLLSSIRNKHVFVKDDTTFTNNRFGISSQYVSYANNLNYRMFIDQDFELNKETVLSINSTGEYLSAGDQFYLRNTHLQFRNKNLGVSVGSLFHSGEVAVNGRGVTADVLVNEKSKFEAGFIDKTFNITDPFKNSRGNSFWFSYHPNKTKTTNTTFYADNENYNDIKKYILYHTHQIKNTTNFKVNYQQGLSILSAPKQSPFYGVLAGLNSFYQFKNIVFTGTHQVSSPYYAGIRRGVVLLQQKIGYRYQKNAIDLAYNYYQYQPKAIGNFEFFGLTSTNRSATLGHRYNSTKWTFGGDFNFYTEKQNFSNYSNLQQLQGVKANLHLQHRFPSSGLVLAGTGTLGKLNNHEIEVVTPYNYKADLQLEFKNVRLSVLYQYNFHNIYETYMSQSNEVFKAFSFNSSGNHQFYKNKIKLNWGLSYIINPQYEGLQSTLNFNYNFNNKWDAFVGVYNNANKIRTTNHFYQVEVGFVRKFNNVKLHEKRHNITIQVFYNNGNGELIEAKNRKVYINDYVLITNEYGKATLSKAISDTYTIKTESDEMWLAQQEKIFLHDDVMHKIVLNKTTTIKGTLKWTYEKNPFNIDKTTTIFIVKATNANGDSYKTIVDNTGRYTLFLPEGDYQLSIHPQASSPFFDIRNQTTHVKTSKQPVVNDFSVHVKTREVETKKFNSVKF